MKKKSSLFWLVLSLLFAVAMIVFGTMYEKRQTSKMLASTNIVAKDMPSDVNALYLNKEHYFLKEKINKKEIDYVKEHSKSEDDEKELKDVEARFNIQKEFNSLYDMAVLSGDNFKKDVELKSTTTKEQIDSLTDKVKKKSKDDPFYKDIENYLSASSKQEANSEDDTVKNEEVNEGTNTEFNLNPESTGTVEQAQSAVSNIIVDGQVQGDFTMEQYNIARDAIKSLPEGSEKDALLLDLAQIQAALTNMGIPYEE